MKLLTLLSIQAKKYLRDIYQALILFLSIGIQVTIGVQWLVQVPPASTEVEDGRQRCSTSFLDQVYSLSYVMGLIMFTGLLSAKNRRNISVYQEGNFIGLTMLFSIVIWLIWTLTGGLTKFSADVKDACVAFGLFANATLILVVMFLPKLRHISEITHLEQVGEIYNKFHGSNLHLPKAGQHMHLPYIKMSAPPSYHEAGISTPVLSSSRASMGNVRGSNQRINKTGKQVCHKIDDKQQGCSNVLCVKGSDTKRELLIKGNLL